jgi:hypothetical protein
VYACVVPSGVVAAAGVMAIDTNSAAVMVNPVEPVTPPAAALIVAPPRPTLLACPLLSIVADAGVSELQLALAVRSCVVPLVKLPVAVKACLVPNAMEALPGVMAIDTNAAALTVSVVDPCTDPALAVMVAEPVATLLASPWLPALLLIVAAEVVSELHCTVPVTSCVLPSVKLPVAVNCFVVPNGISGIAGVTAIETSAAGLTLSVVVPETVPAVALTPVLPTATLLATPCPLTVAMAEFAVSQATAVVKSKVPPSLYVPVALSGSVVPRAKPAFAGVMANETSAAGRTVRVADPLTVPEAAVTVVTPCLRLVANPLVFMLAMVGALEVHEAELLRVRLVPSV